MEELIIDQNVINDLKEIGDDEFLKELMETFITQGDEIVEQIEKAYFDNDNVLLSQLAHKLKGSALNIGANKLGSASKYIELNTKSEFPDDMFNRVHELKDIYRATKNELNIIIK